MDQLIARFAEQLDEALEIGKRAAIRPLKKTPNHVYVAGMGGSGIGADFVAAFIREECKIPYLVGKGYDIPAYIGPQSLCIVSSYSGNTEETLSCFDQMLNTGARIMCIASGGRTIDHAKNNVLDYIQVPGDWPSPRACLGYSLVAQLWVLHKLDLISNRTLNQVALGSALIKSEIEDIRVRAEKIAAFLHGKIPVIYTTDRIAAVGVRFRQQINENAKALGWHRTVPEMNHNELVGWREKNNALGVIYLRNSDDFSRNQIRIDINKEIIANYTDTVIEVFSKGNSLVERSLYLVHLVDWISWYLCQLRGMDSIEVKVIDFLKSELAKV